MVLFITGFSSPHPKESPKARSPGDSSDCCLLTSTWGLNLASYWGVRSFDFQIISVIKCLDNYDLGE